MMNTPIYDFVKSYADGGFARLHMPGHKGIGALGCEPLDITEISGADSLYEASEIIRESEKNASSLFGADTYYSTEGSSQCIRAMLALCVKHAKKLGKNNLVLALRNAHKTFLSAAALLDFDIGWIGGGSYLSCDITPALAESEIIRHSPAALYVTSPDYLGKTVDIRSLAEVCHRHGVLLLVDNAHGAYLRFLEESRHPIDLGADICCDSAHKTLPVLTGGAYLHVAKTFPHTDSHVKDALALFGSTSPSYLTLASLDLANRYIADGYGKRLSAFCEKVKMLKDRISALGYHLFGDEPLKITLMPKSYGYLGSALAGILEENGVICEFADRDFLVLMLTPENEDSADRLLSVLSGIEKKPPITEAPPTFSLSEKVLSPREAMLSDSECIPVEKCEGRVLAAAGVACPPAVPIVMCGERIDKNAIKCFEYYGITSCSVVKEC